MRSEGYKCYNSECKYYWGEVCRASSDVTLTCVGRVVHKKTNADHIRSLSDEELAVFLECFSGCHYCSEYETAMFDNDGILDCDGDCEQHILDWLKQPYKDGDE